VAVLHYQEGNLAGRDLELLDTGGEGEEEILSAFLAQYYGNRGMLPKQILLSASPEDEVELGRFLSHQAGRKVELVTPQRGAKRDLIRMAKENAREECERVTTGQERTAKILAVLAEKLDLPAPPHRIEAYDISNTGSSDMVAAMTVFEDGKPKKGAYRYFRIKDLTGPDDYASMEQTLTRRFRREGEEDFAQRPDLLLMDGGATHAAVAQRVLAEFGLDIPVFGMVKDDRHRTRALVTAGGEEIGIQAVPALFAFIGQIQEETHRSAVGFHHKQHTKSTLGSQLEKIPGIGPTRRKALLKHFGSVKAIKGASLPQLEEVVSKPAAKAVWQAFHPTEGNEPTPETE
jgi:excinuclease ABC subunit C